MNVVQSSWIANNVSVNPGTRSQAFQAVSLPQWEGDELQSHPDNAWNMGRALAFGLRHAAIS